MLRVCEEPRDIRVTWPRPRVPPSRRSMSRGCHTGRPTIRSENGASASETRRRGEVVMRRYRRKVIVVAVVGLFAAAVAGTFIERGSGSGVASSRVRLLMHLTGPAPTQQNGGLPGPPGRTPGGPGGSAPRRRGTFVLTGAIRDRGTAVLRLPHARLGQQREHPPVAQHARRLARRDERRWDDDQRCRGRSLARGRRKPRLRRRERRRQRDPDTGASGAARPPDGARSVTCARGERSVRGAMEL
jgi:hypothetical protein